MLLSSKLIFITNKFQERLSLLSYHLIDEHWRRNKTINFTSTTEAQHPEWVSIILNYFKIFFKKIIFEKIALYKTINSFMKIKTFSISLLFFNVLFTADFFTPDCGVNESYHNFLFALQIIPFKFSFIRINYHFCAYN